MKPKYAMCVSILSLLGATRPDGPQSLADLAKKEAERRKIMDQKGVEARVVGQGDPAKLAPKGNLSSSSPAVPRAGTSRIAAESGRKPSAEKFRAALQKLDGEIRRAEERLAGLRKRLEVERSVPVRLGRGATSGTTASQRLEAQVRELEVRIRRLRDERLKTWDSGRKAGFLPGELDGKGIIP